MKPLRRLNTTTSRAVLLCFLTAAAAQAATVSFYGTRFESLPAASSGRCDPIPTLIVNNTIGIATGTSNLGSFLPDQTSCLHVPFPALITDGVFTWTFEDGDTIDGIFSGSATRTITPAGRQIFQLTSYTVLGGTGLFTGVSGSISESGSGTSTGTSAIANYTFSGTLTGPQLTPEPESLMLVSTGLLGFAMRFRRRRPA